VIWLIAIAAVFWLLVYVGRQSRLGRLRPGPWIRQFRAARSLIGTALCVFGITLLVRGLVWEGVAAIVLGIGMMGSVRLQTSFRRDEPQVAAAYSQSEIAAYHTLGLAVGADRAAIKAAWKRLIRDAHPDQGGSLERTQALNAAKDLLLKRR
jgi:hypothetical protein